MVLSVTGPLAAGGVEDEDGCELLLLVEPLLVFVVSLLSLVMVIQLEIVERLLVCRLVVLGFSILFKRSRERISLFTAHKENEKIDKP